jgi:hypothetical protein
MSRSEAEAMWEGPLTGAGEYTALVSLPSGRTTRIDTELEGLAAIASAIYAVAAALNREGVQA